MKTVPFDVNGQTYHLLLNGAALFDIYDRFGAGCSVLDPLQTGGREGFETLCWYLGELCEQGELYRRYMGHSPQSIPTQAELMLLLSPLDANRARAAIQNAVLAGFTREEGEAPKEIDKGLLELQKKTGDG